MEKQTKLILIGAGQRGFGTYGKYAFERPHHVTFEAIVEPDSIRRELFGEMHNIPKKNQFDSVKKLIRAKKKIESRAVINASGDKMHLKTTLPLIRNKFDILLEKPMATTKRSCIRITEEAKKHNARVMICHVLRYAPMFSKIKEIIDQGSIGDLRTIEHEESIGEQHFVHSYVRGNWAQKKTSGPISLTKTCHDYDIFAWLIKEKPQYVYSYSDNLFFQKNNAPYEDVPDKCYKGCKFSKSCKFTAEKIYSNPHTPDFMKRAVSPNMDKKTILNKLKTTNYGNCVYLCDNDVPEYQFTRLDYPSGITVHFIMTGRKKEMNRTIQVIGSKGRIYGDLINSHLILENYTGAHEIEIPRGLGGHGGGDNLLIDDFVKMVREESSLNKTSIQKSLESHLISFAAETSRLNRKKISFDKYCKEVLKEYSDE